jgi:transposase
MKTVPSVSSSEEEVTIKYVCGIDMGSQSCSGCICGPEKRVVVKASDFANTKEGWKVWEEKLTQLDATPNQIIIGMEATSRYHENLYQELEQKGYQMRLLHPGQTHHYHQQQGLRAKTDRLDAMTIARVLRETGKSAWAIFLVSRSLRTANWCGCTPSLSRRGCPLSEPDPGPGGRAFSRVQPGLC